MLKAAESKYNDLYLRWVKLKVSDAKLSATGTDRQQRDYIPGVGDCVDLTILAIGWDKDRARELRGRSSLKAASHADIAQVGPSVMTTLYAGVLTNKTQVARRQQDPHFEILFRISYGMSKTQLADLNNALGRPPYQIRKYGVAECQVCQEGARSTRADSFVGSFIPIHHARRHTRTSCNVFSTSQWRDCRSGIPKDSNVKRESRPAEEQRR